MALISSGQVQQAPDLRPEVRAQSNRTIESVVEGLTAIGGQVVETFDKKNIADIERTVEEDREQIGRMFNENDVRTYLGGVDNATSEDIIKSGKRLQAMQKATRTGAISQMAYDVQVDIATRRLKSKYPGYEDEIDEMIVSKFYGGTPANRVRNELLAASGSEGKSIEQRLMEDRLERFVSMGGSLPLAQRAAQGDPDAMNEIEKTVTSFDGGMNEIQLAKQAADAGKDNAYIVAQKLANAYNGIYSKVLFETENGRKLQEARAFMKAGNFKNFTKEDMDKFEQEIEPQLILARDAIRNQLKNDPSYQKLASQLTQEEQEKILGSATFVIDQYLGSGDDITKDMAVEWHRRNQEYAIAGFQGTNKEFFETGMAIKDALGEQAVAILFSNSGSASGRAIDQIIRNALDIHDADSAKAVSNFFDPKKNYSLQEVLAEVGRHTQRLLQNGDTSGNGDLAAVVGAVSGLSDSIVADDTVTNTQQNNKILSVWDTSTLDQTSFPVQPQSSLQSTETYLKALVKDGTFETIAKTGNARSKAAVNDTITKIISASRVRLNSVLSNSRVTYNPVSGRISFNEEIPSSPLKAIEGISREFSRFSLSEKDIRSTEFIANAYVNSKVALEDMSTQEAAAQFGELIGTLDSIEETEGDAPTLNSSSTTAQGPGGLGGNHRTIYTHLSDNYGVPPQIIAGILGNLMQESGTKINPGSHNTKGEDSFGAVQWNGPRHRAFKKWAKDLERDPFDIVTQMDYLMHEFETTEKGAWNAIKDLEDPEEIAEVLSNKFWRPSDPRLKNRRKYARTVWEALQET